MLAGPAYVEKAVNPANAAPRRPALGRRPVTRPRNFELPRVFAR